MGSGIAQVCAQTGWETVLYDAFPESLKKGEESILSFWKRGIEKGKTSEVEVSSWKANLRTSLGHRGGFQRDGPDYRGSARED